MTTALDGKIALVTGAGGGIGLATAEAFAKAGASVVLADRDEETIGKAAESLRAAGHNTIGVTCDVTDSAQVEAMIAGAVNTYGRLDAAFNNAGVNSEAAALLETSDNEFERVMNVNLRGVWNCMKGELRQMVAQGSGAIVNCSSIGGLKGSIGRSAYSASKHAVIGLTRSAALDYAAQGIRINAICPGMVDTPMAAFVTKNYDPEIVRRMVAQVPIGRFGEPEGIAAAVVCLALQPGRQLHGGSRHDGRWRPPRRLIDVAKVKNLDQVAVPRPRPISRLTSGQAPYDRRNEPP